MWKIENSKTKKNTLLLNGRYLYSRYDPESDVEKFLSKEIKNENNTFLLLGLGLGYHAKYILDKFKNSKIFIMLISTEEINICEKHGMKEVLDDKRLTILNKNFNMLHEDISKMQLIVPLAWVKAIGMEHPLYVLLEVIKTNQLSFKEQGFLMKGNFESNVKLGDSTISKTNVANGRAFLVSAGPSLDLTIKLIKQYNNKAFILSVGSALQTLLKNNIIPDAVIISDATSRLTEQFNYKEFKELLFYLSTANHEVVKNHAGPKVILFQQNYNLSEEFAEMYSAPLLETGGSVATLALSLLEFLNFNEVYLFGQDLGFEHNRTHATHSASNTSLINSINQKQVIANNGEMINTRSDFITFKYWFEQKSITTNMKIYNTSYMGAKIKNIPYISQQLFEFQFSKVPQKDLSFLEKYINTI